MVKGAASPAYDRAANTDDHCEIYGCSGRKKSFRVESDSSRQSRIATVTRCPPLAFISCHLMD
jgi:hypothetical protein